MHGFDEARRAGIVAEYAAQLGDTDIETLLLNGGVAPDRVEQLRLGDQLSPPRGQVAQDRPGLRPQCDRFVALPQTLVGQVDAKWRKGQDCRHGPPWVRN